ncbi:transcription factor [Diplodia corticola]|uniref:Transcription factor n=1 Tax=Diplodia corticola TaxID=236234 RepID=A0A1J9REL9_9PEZI|nr:transcription factor [Diplodia corticola]OJD31011.1 transcription factor [Diplodia corticola]
MDDSGSAPPSSRPLERRATVGEASSPSHQPHRWRPRSKSVSNACERCRRRKIRCDGEVGPCSTCVRFCVACVRPPKLKVGAHRALASRIHQLEAQLADLGDAHSPAWSDSIPTTSLHLDTTFNSPQPSLSWDFSPSTHSAAASPAIQQPDIPTIEISECGGPASPTLLSPAPSLLSANSRCSTPDPYTITTPIILGCSAAQLAPPLLASPVSPPVSAYGSSQRSQWDFSPLFHGDASNDGACYLSPPPADRGGDPSSLSRRSSISSLGLDHDFYNAVALHPFSPFEEDPLPLPPSPSPNAFGERSRPNASSRPPTTTQPQPQTQTQTPTKFEAETLSDIFFDGIDPSRWPVEPAVHHACLDRVYDDDHHHNFPELSYSLRMARFLVFMTLAVGMRLRQRQAGARGTGGRGGFARVSEKTSTEGNALLGSCYGLAMRQAECAEFWCEVGAGEAAALLALFAAESGGGVVQGQGLEETDCCE